MIVSAFFLPIFYLLNFVLFRSFILDLMLNIWYGTILIFGIFLFVYGLIPSFQVASNSKNKKIKAFFGTLLLHHMCGLAWGIGLMVGIKNYILGKN